MVVPAGQEAPGADVLGGDRGAVAGEGDDGGLLGRGEGYAGGIGGNCGVGHGGAQEHKGASRGEGWTKFFPVHG